MMGKLANLLEGHKLMYKIRIDPTYVHVHPMNRDGVGVYHSGKVALLSDIADAGWQWEECRPMCVEAHGEAQIEK